MKDWTWSLPIFSLLLLTMMCNFSAGYLCYQVNVTLRETSSPVVVNGVVSPNWLRPVERADDFTFDVSHAIDAPKYQVTFLPKPNDGLSVIEHSIQTLTQQSDQWHFKTKCGDGVSYRYSMELTMNSNILCPPITFSWTKVCGSGEPTPRKGLAITLEPHSHHYVVRDGVLIDQNFMQPLPGVSKSVIGGHHDHLFLYFHLLPIHRSDSSVVINTNSIQQILKIPNYQSIYTITPMHFLSPILKYNESMVYPVLKEEIAKGGVLNVTTPQKLRVVFNCLGVVGKTFMELKIPIPMNQPIVLYIEKECTAETWIDKLEEAIIDEEEKFGILHLLGYGLLFFIVVFVGFTCVGMCQGKAFTDSIPCGKSLLERFEGNTIHSSVPSSSRIENKEIQKFPGADLESEDTAHGYGSVS